MTRTATAFVLVLLVVTAGCSTGVLQDEGTPTPDDAGTPDGTATPDGGAGDGATPTATPSGLPPGVSGDSLENETALFEANEDALDKSAYVFTARTNLTARGDVRATVTSNSIARSDAADGYYARHVVNDSIQGNTTTEIWSDGSVTLARDWKNTSMQREPQVQFKTVSSTDDTGVSWPGTSSMFLLVTLLQFEVASDSDERVTLTATDVNRTAFEEVYGEDGTVTEFEGELVVDTQGRIQAFEGHLDVEPGSAGASSFDFVRGSYQLETTSDVEVERPAWVSAAREAVPIVDVSIEVVDDTSIRVTNEGPDAIPAGVGVGLFEDSNGGTTATLGEPVEPGESIYLYKPTDASAPGITRERPDEAARDLSGDYTVYIAESVDDVLVDETVTVEG